MDKEEFIQKAYQLLLEKDGKKSAEALKKYLEKQYKDRTIVQDETPQEVVDFWTM